MEVVFEKIGYPPMIKLAMKINLKTVLAIVFLVYLILAFKNPWSTRSLIPNLEPYPDTLYYATPAWNLAHGLGFELSAYGKQVPNLIPPVYSLYLLPFFRIANDIRIFYIANLFLGLLTITFFELSLDCLLKHFKFKWVALLGLGMLLVSNFYFFNLPTLLMAENITLAVASVMLWLIVSEANKLKVKLSGLLVALMCLIKYSNLPIGIVFGFVYLVKIFKEKKLLRTYVMWNFGWLVFLLIYIGRHLETNYQIAAGDGFSLKYFWPNLKLYMQSLLGGHSSYLWFTKSLDTEWILVFGLFGMVVGIFKKETRFVSLSMAVWIFSLIFFMSTFYAFDLRYIFALYPLVIFGIGVLVEYLCLQRKDKLALIGMTLLLLFGWLTKLGGENDIRLVSLKKQIGLNFRHQEVPWNFVCAQNFAKFLSDKKSVYFASFLPSSYFYLLKMPTENYLPIASDQDLMKRGLDKYYPEGIEKNVSNILGEGNTVYFSDYYKSNGRENWDKELDNFEKSGKVAKVFQDPENVCNIYQINSK